MSVPGSCWGEGAGDRPGLQERSFPILSVRREWRESRRQPSTFPTNLASFSSPFSLNGASQVAHWQRICLLNAGNTRDVASIPGSDRSIPGSDRSPGGKNGNPLPYSCMENPMDRGTWQATVYGVAETQTQLSMHAHFSLNSLSASRSLKLAPYY